MVCLHNELTCSSILRERSAFHLMIYWHQSYCVGCVGLQVLQNSGSCGSGDLILQDSSVSIKIYTTCLKL